MFNRQMICVVFMMMVFLLAACGGQGRSAQPPVSGVEVEYGEAAVERVEVVFLESFPLQVQLDVEGYLPDGCSEIESTKVDYQDGHFEVTIRTVRPSNIACTEAIEPFNMNVLLDAYGLAAGKYSVNVNGVKTSFTFGLDNILIAE